MKRPTNPPHEGNDAAGAAQSVPPPPTDTPNETLLGAKLSESERKYREVFDATSDAIFIHELGDGRLVDVNEAMVKMYGYATKEEALQESPDIMNYDQPPYTVREAREHLRRAVEEGPQKFEWLARKKSGEMFWVEVALRCVTIGDRRRVLASVRDIAERKRAESALRENEERLRLALAAADQGLFELNFRTGRFVVSEQLSKILGYPLNEVGYTLDWARANVHPEDLQLAQERMRDCVSGKSDHYRLETRMRTSSGDWRWILTLGKVIERDSEGKVLRILGTHTDTTERKQTEERLREQAALLNAANDAIYIRALDHTVTYWNDGAERLHSVARPDALGRKITELASFNHDAFEAAHATLLEQGHWSGELDMTTKAGKAFTVFCRWTMVSDEHGQHKEILAINTDITEQKQLEANLLRAQRMEGIGALAGGIAHDLNNILQPILMTVPLLQETTGDPDSLELLETVKSCAQRGADIIKQLLTFARGTPGARVPLPVRHLLHDMEKIIRETFPRNIQLRIEAPKELWPVLGDATQIHQALMNLCVNARDAMPNGGQLALVARNLNMDEAFAAMIPNAKPGLYVGINVSDTGTGIPPELLDRIFDPFFTTKEIGKGTGLGLATVLGIMRGHGGFLQVKSQPRKGTTFELYLPAVSEDKAATAAGHEKRPPRATGQLILVVDDEAHVRSMVHRVLENEGYRTLTAAEGNEALKLFAEHRAEIRAVITDMMMPGMDGPALVRSLQQKEPHLPILGMSGVAERLEIKGLENINVPTLLTKPFSSIVLLNALHQVLTAGPEPARHSS